MVEMIYFLSAGFVTPLLAGLGAAAISIPIIIHLLSRRPRKPMPWAAMKFLLAAYKKHRMRLQMESLILLLVRCLIVLLLGLALAQPLLDSAGLADQLGGSGKTVLIVLDNGIQTSAKVSDTTTRFDLLRKQAEEVLGALGPTDQAGLITTGKPAAGRVTPATAEPAAVSSELSELEVTAGASDLSSALEIALEAIKTHPDQSRRFYVFLLSDFVKGAVDVDQPLPTTLSALGQVATLVMGTPQETLNNVQIAHFAPDRRVAVPETPGTQPTVQWRLELRRFGMMPSGQTTAIRLSAKGRADERRVVTWDAGQATQTLTFSTLLDEGGEVIYSAELEPMDRTMDVIDLDNARTGLTEVRKTLNVLILARKKTVSTTGPKKFSPERLIELALAPTLDASSWAFKTRVEDPATLDETLLAEADVVFALQPDLIDDPGYARLGAFVGRGGVVWFTPSAGGGSALWPTKLSDVFKLGWSVGLEPEKHEEGEGLKLDVNLAEGFKTARLNMEQLSRPVRLNQSLAIDASSINSPKQLLLQTSGGQPVLVVGQPTGAVGRVILMSVAVDTDWTNLYTKPLFVPLLQESLRVVLDALQPLDSYEPGEQPLLTGQWVNESSLRGPKGQSVLLVKRELTKPRVEGEDDEGGAVSAVRPRTVLVEPGVYAGRTSTLLVNVAGNASDTTGSDPEALEAWLGTVGDWKQSETNEPAQVLAVAEDQADIAWPLLWVVLALVLFETFFARYVSRGRRGKEESIMPAGGVTSW